MYEYACVLKITIEKQILQFTPLLVFITMFTMLLSEVSELSPTEKYEYALCIFYDLVLQFLLTFFLIHEFSAHK